MTSSVAIGCWKPCGSSASIACETPVDWRPVVGVSHVRGSVSLQPTTWQCRRLAIANRSALTKVVLRPQSLVTSTGQVHTARRLKMCGGLTYILPLARATALTNKRCQVTQLTLSAGRCVDPDSCNKCATSRRWPIHSQLLTLDRLCSQAGLSRTPRPCCSAWPGPTHPGRCTTPTDCRSSESRTSSPTPSNSSLTNSSRKHPNDVADRRALTSTKRRPNQASPPHRG